MTAKSFIGFLLKEMPLNRFKSKTYHTMFGLHSNIPECCIEAFLTNKTVEHDPRRPYARCQKCFNNNYRQKLHKCTNKCVPFLASVKRAMIKNEPSTEWIWPLKRKKFHNIKGN